MDQKDAHGQSGRTLDAELDKDLAVLKFVFASAASAVIAYSAYMGLLLRAPAGGPDAWAQFGDYIGGILNPVIGIATAILVIRTLQTTRREAELTRQQLEAQTAHMAEERADARRASTLEEMHKRLDGCLTAWQQAMSTTIRDVVRWSTNDGDIRVDEEFTTLGTVLYDPEFLGEVKAMQLIDRPERARVNWVKHFFDVGRLLREMALYCREYDALAGGSLLTDFYRLRVERAAFVLRQMDLISEKTLAELSVDEPE